MTDSKGNDQTGGTVASTGCSGGGQKAGISPKDAAEMKGLIYDESKARIPLKLNEELATAQDNVKKAKELLANTKGIKGKTVSVNGGNHVSGYDTASSKTPEGFSPIGRDPVIAVERDKALLKSVEGGDAKVEEVLDANSSVDPQIYPDGSITGGKGKKDKNGKWVKGKTIPGGQAATHSEKQAMQEQQEKGTNHPVGISQDQCGNCRKQHRLHAKNKGRPSYPESYVAGEPSHTRVYNSDGSIDVYKPTSDGGHGYVGTAAPDTKPKANIAASTYKGTAW